MLVLELRLASGYRLIWFPGIGVLVLDLTALYLVIAREAMAFASGY